MLVADAGLILVLLLWRLCTSPETASIAEVAPLIVLAGVLTAVLAFLFNLRRGRSEDVLEAASDLLEKAYEALLTKEGALTNLRHAWLSSARLIAAAEQLAKRIAEPSHESIYSERREYWRGRLYDLIFPSPPEGLPSSFYAEKPEHMIGWSGKVRDLNLPRFRGHLRKVDNNEIGGLRCRNEDRVASTATSTSQKRFD